MTCSIVIQRFSSADALRRWLDDARRRHGRHDFADWLIRYTRNRELVINDRTYRYAECLRLIREGGR